MTTGSAAKDRAEIDGAAPAHIDVDELEQRAKQSRERLLKAVEALDKKRHQLTNPVKGLPAGVLPAAAAAVVAGAVGSIAAFALSKRRHRSGLAMLFRRREEPSFASQLVRHAGLSVLTFALVEAAKVGIRKLTPTQAEIESAGKTLGQTR